MNQGIFVTADTGTKRTENGTVLRVMRTVIFDSVCHTDTDCVFDSYKTCLSQQRLFCANNVKTAEIGFQTNMFKLMVGWTGTAQHAQLLTSSGELPIAFKSVALGNMKLSKRENDP